MVEWAVIAVVGGFIIGFLISFIYLHLREKEIKLNGGNTNENL